MSLLFDENEYKKVFHRVESFIALAELDWTLNCDNVPEFRRGRSGWIGRHVHAERYLPSDVRLGQVLLRETQEKRRDWWPIQGGMFGGDDRRAEAAALAFLENENAAQSLRLW